MVGLLLGLLESCTPVQGIRELEAGLNQSVGNPPPFRGRENMWAPISESLTHIEYEFKRPGGCSYAVSVNKKTNIVESWRFTSSRSLCEKAVGAPGA